jgi:dTDP-4-amino-4,6-dideoxygalactose transaminase
MADPAAEYRALKPELDAAVQRVLASGRYILGPELEALERELGAYIGAGHAVGVNSGTDALHLALRAAGIGAGDEAIVPAFTFFASAEAVVHAGATVVFADIDTATFNLDPGSLRERITPRTRAVIVVHLFGQCAELDAIGEICRQHDLVLIEDCAQALGADDGGRQAGSVGRFGCFSFYPTKTLAAMGDAGLVTCPDEQDAQMLRMLRHHGSRTAYRHERIGWNSRLDEVQAAVLRVKLAHIEKTHAARQRVASAYRERLAGAAIGLPFEHGRGRHVWHQFTITSERRDAIHDALARESIASARFYAIPLHQQPAFADAHHKASLAVSERLSGLVLSLPIHPYLGEGDIDRICRVVIANA